MRIEDGGRGLDEVPPLRGARLVAREIVAGQEHVLQERVLRIHAGVDDGDGEAGPVLSGRAGLAEVHDGESGLVGVPVPGQGAVEVGGGAIDGKRLIEGLGRLLEIPVGGRSLAGGGDVVGLEGPHVFVGPDLGDQRVGGRSAGTGDDVEGEPTDTSDHLESVGPADAFERGVPGHAQEVPGRRGGLCRPRRTRPQPHRGRDRQQSLHQLVPSPRGVRLVPPDTSTFGHVCVRVRAQGDPDGAVFRRRHFEPHVVLLGGFEVELPPGIADRAHRHPVAGQKLHRNTAQTPRRLLEVHDLSDDDHHVPRPRARNAQLHRELLGVVDDLVRQ